MNLSLSTTEYSLWVACAAFYIIDNIRIISWRRLILAENHHRCWSPVFPLSNFRIRNKTVVIMLLLPPWRAAIETGWLPPLAEPGGRVRLVRDGLKDMFRGSDMTLRLAEDQAINNHRTMGWRMLTGAYMRQIDHIIDFIQIHLQYYDENEPILFYAQEIVTCLEDVKRMFADVKNVRELDDRLDSNKNIINAVKFNLDNLFERLISFIDEPAQTSGSYTKGVTKTARTSADSDHDQFPHPYHAQN